MKKGLRIFLAIVIVILVVFLGIFAFYDSLKELKQLQEPVKKDSNFIEENIKENTLVDERTNVVILNENPKTEKKISDWRLVLVNYENYLPDDFELNLSSIDKTRQFDSRAIEYLNQMLVQMKKDGIKSTWVQSAYRSVEYQKELYDEKMQEIMSYGISQNEAEVFTSNVINKPGTSEHNLGLAIDFNYVDEDFDKTEGFAWLIQNAENYGFILRYKKEKEEVTKVSYEPWHWRFVGQEHAILMNDLDMCLEEYIEYLKNQ